MEDTHSTRMIFLDEDIPEGYINIINKQDFGESDLGEETSDINCLTYEGESVLLETRYAQRKPMNFYDWLGIAATKVSNAMVIAFASSQLNIARLSSDNLHTGPVDASAIIRTIVEERSSVVSISQSLVMRREQVQDSSLLAPSGAYLTWVEMLQDPLSDEE